VSGPEPGAAPVVAAVPGLRGILAEWRRFLGSDYRVFRRIGLSAAVVSALAGDGLTIPFVLGLGAAPWAATVIGVLPFAFSSAQLLVPRLLRRSGGNLRGITLLILAVGETRGFILAAVALLGASGTIPRPVAIAAIAIVASVAGAATTIGGTNLLAWYGAILTERERRFVAPRVMGITLGVGAFLLLPVALVVQLGLSTIGLRVYALFFLLSGCAGIVEILALRRLRRPGRVLVAGSDERVPEPPEVVRFIRSIALAAFGAGFGPYLSIYAISVLHLSPGFAIVLSALSSAASLVASTVVGSWLGRGSSSRLLRVSFLLRGGSMILGLLAFPGNPLAWLVLSLVAVIVSAGAAAGTIAANERLLRLTGGMDLIGAQGRFVAGSAAGVTAGQLSSALLLAVAPISYPTFALLFAVSGVTRFVAAARAQVSESWSSATAAWRVEDLQQGPRK
jgi:hypothetical protein